jgi:uncharacterized protein
MSQKNVEVVRMPVAVAAVSHRRLDEQLVLRFPRVVAFAVRAARRLPRHSRLSQNLVRRSVQVFLEAYNRKDFESTYALFHPDCETVVPHQFVAMGFDQVTRGPDAPLRVQRRWHTEWGEFRIEPDQVIDLGDRVLLLGHIKGSGLSSGAGMETEWGNLITLARGRIIREEFFFDRREALEAAGLSE